MDNLKFLILSPFFKYKYFITNYYISIFAYTIIYNISFHILTHLQRQFCIEIYKSHTSIEVKINQLKVDASDSIFQFGTKSHQLFLAGILLAFKDARKVWSPPCQKLEKKFQTESYRKKSVSKFGVTWKDLAILRTVNWF